MAVWTSTNEPARPSSAAHTRNSARKATAIPKAASDRRNSGRFRSSSANSGGTATRKTVISFVSRARPPSRPVTETYARARRSRSPQAACSVSRPAHRANGSITSWRS